MTEYWLDFTTGGGTDDGGDGSEGNPFKSPYAARTAFATGGNIFHGKGRYVRLRPTSGSGRSVTPIAAGTARNPSIMHGYDPAHPFEWWAGAMLRATADSGPTWTDNGAGTDGGGGHVFYSSSMGYAVGGQEDHAQHLLWYYDLTDQSTSPRQLAYAKDAIGGAHAGVDAAEDSFWFDPVGQVIWVHLRSGESPDGKIMVPSSDAFYGDVWGSWPDNFFKGRKNIVFDGFSYLYCGTRPWDASDLTVGHAMDGVELRRGRFGFTWASDAVIRPVKKSRRLIIDECTLQCGGIGIVYSYSGVGSGPEISAPGHIMTGLRLTRSHLLDAGYTHRGQGDGHAIGAQASASDWICAGNLADQTTRPIVMWPRSKWYPGVALNKIEILFNTIVNTHDSGIAQAQRTISWENTDSAAAGTYDQTGSSVCGNIIRGPINRISVNYYNGALLDLSGTPGTRYDSPAGIRTARTHPANVVATWGNQISGLSIGLSQEQIPSDATIAVDYRWNTVRSLTKLVPNSLQSFVYCLSNIGEKPKSIIDYNVYVGFPVRFKAGGTPPYYDNITSWRTDTRNDMHSTVKP